MGHPRFVGGLPVRWALLRPLTSSCTLDTKVPSIRLSNRFTPLASGYKADIPGNGKPFPDGAKMVKVHLNATVNAAEPGAPTVPGAQHDVDLMVKDSKGFADSGGWGYGAFEYDAASDTFMPATLKDKPPQGNDAKCGFACHTAVKSKDYVFTDYGRR